MNKHYSPIIGQNSTTWKSKHLTLFLIWPQKYNTIHKLLEEDLPTLKLLVRKYPRTQEIYHRSHSYTPGYRDREKNTQN